MQNMESITKLPIGIENFEEIRSEGFYYVDKTGLIRDLIYNWGKVNLFTRPRRFGKSLNMSMLKYFFESGCDRTLFDGLEIARDKELCDNYLGKFPVISISLKSVCAENFETARGMLCSVIGNEALRFQNLLVSDQLTRHDLVQYEALLNVDIQGRFTMSDEALMNSLFVLSQLLRKYSNQKVIILVDEYDVPLDKAQQYGYYNQMVNLIRNLFNQSLKSNDNLYFAVLTGCLRVSKESIFTGLNNPQVFSISDPMFDKYFGFTDMEVQKLLSCYDLSEHYDTIKEWYDGYQFGNTDMYCPWDVLNYCRDLRVDSNARPQDYWSNTSGNDIVKCFIQKADKTTTRKEIEQLIAGEIIRKPIHQELTYKELYDSTDNLWSVLYTTGYLTKNGSPEGKIFSLKIPNQEILQIFTSQIYSWFQENAEQDGATLNAFCEAFKNGDAAEAERMFNNYLLKTISIRDTAVRKSKKENFYHGILLGLLSYKESWAVSSNKESGEGYSDILIEIEEERTGIVIEVKYPDSIDLDAGCREALQQIEKLNYADVLFNNGMETVLKYGIACRLKRCRVIVETCRANL